MPKILKLCTQKPWRAIKSCLAIGLETPGVWNATPNPHQAGKRACRGGGYPTNFLVCTECFLSVGRVEVLNKFNRKPLRLRRKLVITFRNTHKISRISKCSTNLDSLDCQIKTLSQSASGRKIWVIWFLSCSTQHSEYYITGSFIYTDTDSFLKGLRIYKVPFSRRRRGRSYTISTVKLIFPLWKLVWYIFRAFKVRLERLRRLPFTIPPVSVKPLTNTNLFCTFRLNA